MLTINMSTTPISSFIFGTTTPPTVNTPVTKGCMFCGVDVHVMCTSATITETRPIETIKPLIRLLRVWRNSSTSATRPIKATTPITKITANGKATL